MSARRIEIKIPEEVCLQLARKRLADDSCETEEFFNRLILYANAPEAIYYSEEGAGGELMENFPGTFCCTGLDIYPDWTIHCALVGQHIVVRVGYLWDGCALHPNIDYVKDEIWLHIYSDDIDQDIPIRHKERTVATIRFK